MSGENPTGPVESDKEREAREEAEMLAWYEAKSAAPDSKRDHKEEMAQFERMIAEFEQNYPVDALNAITDLPMAEAAQHPLREPAKQALIPISTQLSTIREKTNITPEALEILNVQWKRISDAVGYFNRGVYVHSRD